jgi:hypothetical protein
MPHALFIKDCDLVCNQDFYSNGWIKWEDVNEVVGDMEVTNHMKLKFGMYLLQNTNIPTYKQVYRFVMLICSNCHSGIIT